MSSRTDITPLSITNGKISNQAKIDPRKLAPAKEGQVLIAGKDGKFLAGDLPTTTVTNTVTTEEEVLPPNQIKIGPNTAEPGATNQFVNVGAGEHSIPRRDSSGNLKAETADRATNADQATTATNADNATLLNGNNMEYYRNVANHVAETATTSTDSNNNDTSQQRTPHKVFEFDVPSDSGSYSAAGTGPSNYPIEFTHNCGYIPDVSVYYKSNSAGASDPWEEVDAEVQNTTTTTKVQLSIQGANLKIVAK